MNEKNETDETRFFLEPLTELANKAIETKVKKEKVCYLDTSSNEHYGYLTIEEVVADISKTKKCFEEIKFNIFVVNNSGILEENGFHFQQHPDYY